MKTIVIMVGEAVAPWGYGICSKTLLKVKRGKSSYASTTKRQTGRRARAAQSLERLTLDLRVVIPTPALGSTVRVEPT